jgi:hypothetical protein
MAREKSKSKPTAIRAAGKLILTPCFFFTSSKFSAFNTIDSNSSPFVQSIPGCIDFLPDGPTDLSEIIAINPNGGFIQYRESWGDVVEVYSGKWALKDSLALFKYFHKISKGKIVDIRAKDSMGMVLRISSINDSVFNIKGKSGTLSLRRMDFTEFQTNRYKRQIDSLLDLSGK